MKLGLKKEPGVFILEVTESVEKRDFAILRVGLARLCTQGQAFILDLSRVEIGPYVAKKLIQLELVAYDQGATLVIQAPSLRGDGPKDRKAALLMLKSADYRRKNEDRLLGPYELDLLHRKKVAIQRQTEIQNRKLTLEGLRQENLALVGILAASEGLVADLSQWRPKPAAESPEILFLKDKMGKAIGGGG